MPPSKRFYLLRKLVKNGGQNRIYPSLTLLAAKFFPLKKSKPKSDKLQQNKQQQQQQTTIFLPKTNKVFLSPIIQNLKGRSVLDNFFLKMILSTSRIGCHHAKSSISLGRRSKTQNGDQNLIYPSLTLLIAKIFPLKRVF